MSNAEIDNRIETTETIENNIENMDYDQDIIYAQDIESGKDITDITDVEKDDDNKNMKRERISLPFMKKKFIGELHEEEFRVDNEQIRDDNSVKRIVVEKSPKERFARFDEELGAGAFKRVYRGYDYDTGREIAWNVVSVYCLPDEAITKIQEEIAIIKKLNHPNIINFVSGFFNEEKKEVVIITEIFTSGSLKQYLNKIKHPRLKVIKNWCKEILKGLKYLHELPNPIIHRDIKCDNILINGTTSQIKIGDLGYSCILRNDDYAKTLSGTPEFMAPEVLSGKYGVLADIYSFGIMVAEIVTREKPYKECENNVFDIFDKIKNNILPKSLERVKNDRLMEFIKSCLQPENERPSATQLLNTEFLNDCEHEENNYPALMYPWNPENNFENINNYNLSNINTITSNFALLPRKASNDTQNENIRESKLYRISCGFSPIKCNKQEKNEKILPFTYYAHNRGTYSNNEIKLPSELINHYKNSELNPKGNNKNRKLSTNTEYERENYKIKNYHISNQSHIQSSSDEKEYLSPVKNNDNKLKYDKKTRKTDFRSPKKYTFRSPKKYNSSLTKNATIINPFKVDPSIIQNDQNSSKIEIQIEEEYKLKNSIKISLVKKEKPKHKGQKISFIFDLNKDTCDKIIKELESEIGLNEVEKKIIKEKLSTLIQNYTISIGKSNMPFTSSLENKDEFVETKILYDKFLKKYLKIFEKAEDILKNGKTLLELGNCQKSQNEIENEEYNKVKNGFAEKMKFLEGFLQKG